MQSGESVTQDFVMVFAWRAGSEIFEKEEVFALCEHRGHSKRSGAKQAEAMDFAREHPDGCVVMHLGEDVGTRGETQAKRFVDVASLDRRRREHFL